MRTPRLKFQVRILFLLVLSNFLAQIPYVLHLYFDPAKPFANVIYELPILIVFIPFIVGYVLLEKRKTLGWWILTGFMFVDFGFYLFNFVMSLAHGYGLFYQLGNPDLILRLVFAVGYVNLFATGIFLGLLSYKRKVFLSQTK